MADMNQDGGAAVPPPGKKPAPQKPVSEMTDEEYMAELNSHRPTASGEGATPPRTRGGLIQTTVGGFWDRLIHGVPGVSDTPAGLTRELGRSAIRGVAGAGNSLGRAALEFGLWFDRKNGLGELLNPGFNAAFDETGGSRGFINQNPEAAQIAPPERVDEWLGNRSDDPLASFAEGLVQFNAGMRVADLAGVPGFLGKAAVSDALAFDPYEAQLAELAAKAPGTLAAPVRWLGELLSVKGDDGALVARIKRSAAGAILGAAFDGAIAGVRKARSLRTLSDPASTAAEKATAEATLADAQQTLQNVEDGAHTGNGPVTVQPTPDGQFTLRSSEVPGRSVSEEEVLRRFNPTDRANAEAALEGLSPEDRAAAVEILNREGPTPVPKKLTKLQPGETAVPEGPRTIGIEGTRATPPAPTQDTESIFLRMHRAAAGMRFRMREMGQEAGVLGSTPPVTPDLQARADQIISEGQRSLQSRADEILSEFTHHDAPVFANRGEAEATASSMNMGLNARATASTPITPVQMREHFGTAEQIRQAATPEDAARLLEGTHFNFSYRAEPEAVRAHIEALSEQFQRAFDETKGPIPVDDMIREVNKAIGGLTPSEAAGVFKGSKGKISEGVRLLIGNRVAKDMGDRIAQFSELLDARPHDEVLNEEARSALEQYFNHMRDLSGDHSEAGRTLRMLQELNNPKLGKVKLRPEGSPAPAPKANGNGTKAPKPYTAGMEPRDVAAVARMIRMSEGKPRDFFAVVHAANVIKHEGITAKALELFTNFLLSGPKTAQTVFSSGAALNMFEPVVRMAAGIATGNRALLREGADIMWGNMKYLGDNIRSTAASLRAGRSLLNPQAQHIAIGGLTGEAVRMPGRVVGAMDEFNRVSAYRAYVRAKSLRLGRSQGLSGPALEARVADDLRAAFDPNTGVATLPEALKYAEVPTMSSPLADGTLGKGFQEFVNNHQELKFIVPFVKSPVNIFNYVHKATPILNLMNGEVRQALAKGGEEAAVIHTRSAMAAMLYGYGLYQAMGGNITGRGPSDPDLRKLWLKNHQPYSLKIGNKWVSYARLDPLATPLGLISDTHTILNELGDKATDASDMAYATVAAMFYSLSNKSYTQGITEFFNAWANNDPNATKHWMQQMAGSLTVPQGVSSVNPDPVVRDVQSLADAVMARVPGFSTKLDPKFDIFGEPVLKTPGLANRNQMFTSKDAGRSVEDDILDIGRGLAPLAPRLEGGLIDLRDSKFKEDPKQPTPYIRMMELIRNPESGASSLRDAMTELVQSGRWTESSDGTSLMPGGKRWLLASALKTKYEKRALKQVLSEYPKLRIQLQAVRRIKGAAIAGGEDAVNDVEELFGVKAK